MMPTGHVIIYESRFLRIYQAKQIYFTAIVGIFTAYLPQTTPSMMETVYHEGNYIVNRKEEKNADEARY